MNREPAAYFSDFQQAVKGKEGKTVDVTVQREGHVVVIPVKLNDEGMVGLYRKGPDGYLKTEIKTYTLLGSSTAGIKFGWQRMKDNVFLQAFGFQERHQADGRLGEYGQGLWLEVGLVDLLEHDGFPEHGAGLPEHPADPGPRRRPRGLPADEWVARRPANPKVLEYAQMAGMVFLLTVMIAVNGHDIFKMITGQL